MIKRNEVVTRIEKGLYQTGSKTVQPSTFLGSMIGIYDTVYFGRQLKDRLNEIGMKTYPLARICDPLKNASVFECDLNVVYDPIGVPTTLEFIVSPTMWTSPKRKAYYISIIKELQLREEFPPGAKYVMYTCMYVLEHSIVHLLMVLWRYLDKKLSRHSRMDPEVYSTHGAMYKYLLREYFGYTLYSIPSSVIVHRMGKSQRPIRDLTPSPTISSSASSSRIPEAPLHPQGLLKWSNNSCFFDSLMMIIYYGSSVHIRDTITSQDLDVEIDPSGAYVNPYPTASKTRTPEGFQDLFDKTRSYFTDNSVKLLEGKIFHSINLRNALSKVDPNIGGGEQYESSSVYSALALLFRDLLLTNVKVSRTLPCGRTKRVTPAPTPYVSMFDFVTLSSDIGDTYLWETCEEPVLVFFIRQSPWLKKWNEEGEELVNVIDPKRGRMMQSYIKPNPFGEYILNDRYRLFGVVVHSGVAPESLLSVTSGHYTALIRPYFDPGSWYYYDDTLPTFQKVSEGNVPPSAFTDTGRLRPHMFFYERVK